LSSLPLSKYVTIKTNKTTTLPLVLCGCETWSLILREEHRLKVYEKRVQRRIFGPKKDEIVGRWRKLHNELRDLYSTPNIIRMFKSRGIRWAGHVTDLGKKGNHMGFWWGFKKERDH
jgi:hypothetical protein